MPPAGWQQRVDITRRRWACDRAKGEAGERIREELRGERYGETARDEGVNRQLVACERDDVRLEAGVAADTDDQPIGGRGDPGGIAQVCQAHRWTLGQRVVGCHGDEEVLAQQVVTLEARGVHARLCRVLKYEREVKLAGANARREILGGALVERDFGVGVRTPQVCDGGRDEAGKCRGKRTDPQPCALVARGGRELRAGEREALGDGIRVLEQDLTLAGEAQAARLALEQACADLAFEQCDLVGDRWL
jgi:hypothetical protein